MNLSLSFEYYDIVISYTGININQSIIIDRLFHNHPKKFEIGLTLLIYHYNFLSVVNDIQELLTIGRFAFLSHIAINICYIDSTFLFRLKK